MYRRMDKTINKDHGIEYGRGYDDDDYDDDSIEDTDEWYCYIYICYRCGLT